MWTQKAWDLTKCLYPKDIRDEVDELRAELLDAQATARTLAMSLKTASRGELSENDWALTVKALAYPVRKDGA